MVSVEAFLRTVGEVLVESLRIGCSRQWRERILLGLNFFAFQIIFGRVSSEPLRGVVARHLREPQAGIDASPQVLGASKRKLIPLRPRGRDTEGRQQDEPAPQEPAPRALTPP